MIGNAAYARAVPFARGTKPGFAATRFDDDEVGCASAVVMSSVDALLSLARPLIADGALGTGLWEAGLPASVPVETWSVRRPDCVAALHRDFLAAGADILLTNTFGAHRLCLTVREWEGRRGELNRAAVGAAQCAAREVSRPVLIAGSVGPVGLGAPVVNGADVPEILAGQMRELAEAGVDLIWIETMSHSTEMLMAAHAAVATGLPFVITASPHLGSLIEPSVFAAMVSHLERPPLAIGFNCGNGPRSVLDALASLQREAPDALLVGKPSAGIPSQGQGRLDYPATPDDMARFARDAVAMGVRVLGGCCGSTPRHLQAMSAAMQLSGV